MFIIYYHIISYDHGISYILFIDYHRLSHFLRLLQPQGRRAAPVSPVSPAKARGSPRWDSPGAGTTNPGIHVVIERGFHGGVHDIWEKNNGIEGS
jgi:hypothetical protein